MFDQAFATLFRAVDRIRIQLETADPALRGLLAEELMELRQLGDAYMDHWLALDEQILELMDSYDLFSGTDISPASSQASAAQFSHEASASFPFSLTLSHGRAVTAANDPSHGDGVGTADTDLGLAPEPHENTNPALFAWPAWAFAKAEPIAAAFRKGLGYFDLLLFDDAAQSLQDVVQAAPNPIARIYLAAALAAQNRADEALSHLQRARESAQDGRLLCAANEVEAHVRFMQGDLQGAVVCLQDSAMRMPDYQDVWYNLGVCMARQSAWEQAAYALSQAVSLDPDDVDAVTLLAEVQLQNQSVEAALHVCEQALAQFPRHPQLLIVQCRAWEAAGEHERCLRMCRRLVDLHPQLWAPWRIGAWVLMRQGDYAQAATLLKKRLTFAPQDASTLLQLGIAYLLSEQYDAAEAAVLQSLPRASDKALVWIALGRISTGRAEYAKAYRRYLRAIRDPRKSVKRLALYYAGTALAKAGRLPEAQKHLQAALALDLPNPAMLIALGRVAERLGHRREADQLFARAQESVAAPSSLSGL